MDENTPGNNDRSYLYLWKFQVISGKEDEFQQIYGSEGDWVRLFRQAEGYQQTLLLKDLDATGSYTTIDRWVSEAAYRAFRNRFSEEFEALDKRCEGLTHSEVQIGRFERV